MDELEQAITERKPHLSTMEYVRNWFGKHIPGLAGAVVSVVVHPIVGKLVEAAGDLLAVDFRKRFGRPGSRLQLISTALAASYHEQPARLFTQIVVLPKRP